MNTRFVLRLAAREARSSLKRVGIFMTSITLGVAALVAIHSFRDDVARSVEEQAEALLGADVRLSADRPLPDSVTTVLDSLEAAGAGRARVVTTPSMVLAPRSDRVRLLQVRGIDGPYPFYGRVRTEPGGAWERRNEPGVALVDPAVLVQLEAAVGDTLSIGTTRFRIAATVEEVPTDLGFQTALGPRVWISGDALRGAGLLGFGALARHQVFLRMPAAEDVDALGERYGDLFQATRVDMDTAEEEARNLTRAVGFLSRYLGLVGLGALLLGGVGVASAIHVYVKERLPGVAVLRCLGARQNAVFLAYLLQAGALGLAGAALGVAAGVGVQQLLPGLVEGVLPVDVEPRIWWRTVAAGLGVGLWVSLLFALAPLLTVRDVPPLRALRRDVEEDGGGAGRSRLWRAAAYGLLAASVAGLSVWEAPRWEDGLWFAGALAATTALLWLTGVLLIRATRRFFPSGATYTVRQGVSNLFRPRTQTVAVTLALGFGAFVVGTVLQVQASLADELGLEAEEGRPNLLLFDVQEDQEAGVVELLPPGARETVEVSPIIPARLAAVGGRTVAELAADTTTPRGERPARWALRRDYRHTVRDAPTASEEVVAGRWWEPGAGEGTGTRARPAPISLEADLATDLGVVVGDTLTWDVSGREVVSVVTSLRFVDWGTFTTNFFVVFPPAALEGAPRTSVVLARVDDPTGRAAYQRELVDRFPNVSVLDLARVQETVETILGRVDQAIRFLAVFSALAGLVVLAGALATSRHQRLRESALLKTLGARRRQVLAVLLTEYAALGALAGGAGLILATAAAAGMVQGMLEIPFRPSLPVLGGVWVGVAALTVVVGFVTSRGVLRRAPLPVLREAVEQG